MTPRRSCSCHISRDIPCVTRYDDRRQAKVRCLVQRQPNPGRRTRRCSRGVHARQSDAFLDNLPDASGGRTWVATSDRRLRELFTRALEEMRARYLLTYTPAGVKRPGWHDIRVRLSVGRADITARPGYCVAHS